MILTGFRELDNALKALPRSMDHKTWSAINFDRSKPIEQEIKKRAPVGATHNLVNSIGRQKLSAKRTELGAVRTGPMRTRGKKGFAAHFNEFGTKQRRTKSGANRGVMPAKPFIEPAFRATKAQVEKGLEDSARKVLIRTMKRYIKR